MEKELVRFENVTSYNTMQSNVKNLSFSIYEGQTAGMVAVNDTGIEMLLSLLQTNTLDDITGKIYVRGKMVHNQDYCASAKNNIAIIDYNNRLFKGLSTIDNIFVTPRPERHGHVIPQKKERSRFLWLKSELNIDLVISKNCEDISNADRCIIEILRAVTAEAAMIVMIGLLNFLTKREFKRVCDVIQKLRKRGQTFLVIGNNYSEIIDFTDFTILLRDGMNINYLTREKHPNEQELLRCITADMNDSQKSYLAIHIENQNTILEFKNVYTADIEDINFKLYEGQCIVLVSNRRTQDEIMAILQKKKDLDSGEVRLCGKILDEYTRKKLFPYGISFIVSNAYRTMPYMELDYMENLTMGIERKSKQKIVRKSIQRLLFAEAKKEIGDVVSYKYLSDLSKEEKYTLLYQHILFIHPKVAVICSPFTESDYQTRAFITDLIFKLRKEKIAVLILSSTYMKNTNLADEIIEIHHKKIYSVYKQRDSEDYVASAADYQE